MLFTYTSVMYCINLYKLYKNLSILYLFSNFNIKSYFQQTQILIFFLNDSDFHTYQTIINYCRNFFLINSYLIIFLKLISQFIII